VADLNETIEGVVSTEDENGLDPAEVGYHVDSGPNPFFLFIVRPNAESVQIDLDEPGWMTTYATWMRGRSRWYLMTKSTPTVPSRPWLGVDVMEDDQPYYTARHIVRVKGVNAGAQITAYGLGAKRAAGHTDRMWILPNGLICSGEDVDTLGDAVIDSLN
jgi:hypothetical protein